MIYLDANATTPLLPEAWHAMEPWLRIEYGNPSSSYAAGKLARAAIDQARCQIAESIGADPEEIIFTSGGTESVNTALHSLDRLTGQGAAVVSAIEHSAVLRYAESRDREVVRVPVTEGGRLKLSAFERALDGAAYVSLMAANNETGVIQPLQEAAAMARARGIPIHSDAIQVAGKMPINVRELGVDLLSISGHKFHGPRGVGALYVRKGLKFLPLLYGGGQESGRRSGTENTAGIVGMGCAAATLPRVPKVSLESLRNDFEFEVCREITGVTINGYGEPRIPNTSHLSFDQCDAAGLMILLEEAGIACSAGSACMTGKQQPSHVQLAMGIPAERAKTSLRFSFSYFNTLPDVLNASEILKDVVGKLRRVQSAGVGPVVVYSA